MGRPFAIAIVFEDDERKRFLVARHAERGWEIPGGRIEEGEAPLQAAVREFREEIGHQVRGAEVVLDHETPEGRCWVVTGTLGPRVTTPGEEEAIVRSRFVEHLGQVEPLAFPDDPYEAIEDALGVTMLPPRPDRPAEVAEDDA